MYPPKLIIDNFSSCLSKLNFSAEGSVKEFGFIKDRRFANFVYLRKSLAHLFLNVGLLLCV